MELMATAECESRRKFGKENVSIATCIADLGLLLIVSFFVEALPKR